MTAWRSAFPEDELHAVAPARDADAVHATLPDGIALHVVKGSPHGLVAVTAYPRFATRLEVDVTLTQNFAPPGARAAVFVHDALFRSNREWFSRRERLYLAPVLPLARRAQVVLTSTETEAKRLRGFLGEGVPVESTGIGLATSILDATPERPQGLDDTPFVLSVGRLNVRKNLKTTLEAAGASQRLAPNRPLLVVGEPDGLQGTASPMLERLVSDGTVRFLGGVTDAELRWLYEKAAALVFMSFDEGTGLPPIEARHFGCPTVVSDIPVFHETMGNDATFVDPTDSVAIARAIDHTMDDRRGQEASTGRDVTWKSVARKSRTAILAHGAAHG